ncbi:ABC transporter ATP-binding protein [Hellea sp.]|nr:ABC transporter ATP-binding protein [Hellea sp.]MDA9048106.1 ABC transporter ATP-binding protein [Hellea sp.]
MSSIVAENLCLHYPVAGGTLAKMVGMPSPETLVEINSKRYILALNSLNFTIKDGDRIGLMGSNGSGKSTLLKVLGQIYTPTSGSVKTSGKISSLFNINLGIQPDASGRENILIRGLVKGWTRRQIANEIDAIIEFSGLTEFIDLPIRTYSDGMRMRLLFSIATSFSPEILLLDEWIGAGDSKFQEKAAERMNTLVKKSGITVIASHNRTLLQRVCNKIIWLENGRIKMFDDLNKVFAII